MPELLIKTYDYIGDGVELLDVFQDEPHLFYLDSSLTKPSLGRYSFIGFAPFELLVAKNKDPLPSLRNVYQEFSARDICPTTPLTPFPAGMMGYFAYDVGFQLEAVQAKTKEDMFLPDSFWGLYDTVLTIDRLKGQLHICSTGLPEKGGLRKKKAQEKVNHITQKLTAYFDGIFLNETAMSSTSGIGLRAPKNSFTKQGYIRAVDQALDYIRKGDIYQVNLSQRFSFELERSYDQIHLIRLYKILRTLSPSCFGSYFNGETFQIISSSPERFLHLHDDHVETRPMKGTRPRGHSARADKTLKDQLLKSKKDKAELLMITDLERNDLGRVCRPGSVKVKTMRALEEYNTVFQTISTVQGTLQKNKDRFDLIKACFPGGSITGCPKIRAMEIIDELEPTRRGVYTGALGYMSFTGDMDLNILIRTLLMHENKIHFHVGAGIVADSQPENEYEETLVKAQAMQEAIKKVFAGTEKKKNWSAREENIYFCRR